MDHYDRVKRYCTGYRNKLASYKEKRPTAIGSKRKRIISISDLHVPFCREDLVRDIVRKHSGADYCVINGDLFDNNLISTFPSSKEIPFAVEYAAVMEIVRNLATAFDKVILVNGNHDGGRFAREMGKLNPAIKFLVKDSPLKYIAQGLQYSEKGEDLGSIALPNVTFAGDDGPGWFTKIGKAIFCHRMKGFKKAPMANACMQADWFIDRGTDFQCLVAGHSHKLGMIPYKGGRIVIDQGALCLPMDYESDGRCTMTPPDLGYAIVDIDSKGNVDAASTRAVYLGTYQGV